MRTILNCFGVLIMTIVCIACWLLWHLALLIFPFIVIGGILWVCIMDKIFPDDDDDK